MRQVFGLVGPIASGKGTVIQILAEKGYRAYSLSDRIREEIKRRGLEVTRQSLTDVANDLRGTIGADILAKQTAELIEKDGAELVAIDAIRNPAEVVYLRQKLGAKIIGVVADQAKRYEMFRNRGINTEGINTWEEFKKHDDMEQAQEGDYKQQVTESLKLADVIIENNGTIEDVKQKVESVIANL